MGYELKCFNSLCAEINGLYHEAANILGFSDSAIIILYTLAEKGEGCTPGTIYKLFGVSRQTIHSSMKILEQQGIIEIKKGYGRERHIYLTDKAHDTIINRIKNLIKIENDIFNGWGNEEREIIINLLRRYRDEFKENIKFL